MPTPINDTIYQLFAGNRAFVIPTFQRPYAWDKKQWEDLRDDIQGAVHRPHPFHYFAPIHVVPIADHRHPLWLSYRDNQNEDLMALEASNFRDGNGAIETLMVIDGQQRLITLYTLLCAAHGAPWVIALANGREIPKVILNPWLMGRIVWHPHLPGKPLQAESSTCAGQP